MHKRYLPVIFAFIILNSCNRPASETTDSSADSNQADTVENGNMDGDIFMSDSLRAMIDNDFEWTKPDTAHEYEPDEEMVSIHTPEIEICGFSPDGKYFVFTQMILGIGDEGEGRVFIIDVAKNEWATKPAIATAFNLDEADKEIKDGVKRKKDSVLRRYGIKEKNNTWDEFNFIGVNPGNVVMIKGKGYVLDLTVNNLMIELHLKGDGKDILLQKDRKIPASRGSVRRYRLNKALVLGDKIVVFVEYDSDIARDYENYQYYDRKNIAITGAVK